MCECVLVLWLCPCSCLTSLLWISGIFACFTLSVSPCLPPPPPLFSFVSLPPSSLHPAIQNQSTPHSDQREGAFFSLSLLLRRGSAGGREAACVPCCCVPVSLELCSTWISLILPFHMHACCFLTFQPGLFLHVACVRTLDVLLFSGICSFV